MVDNSQIHDCFAIWKDIIIPTAGVVATLIVGIYIAIILKNREQKEQRKLLLIDTFWLFLEKKSNFTAYYIDSYVYNIFEMIDTSYSKFFNVDASEVVKDKIRARMKILNSRIETTKDQDMNCFHVTNKFGLLLGKEIYEKEAQVKLDKLGNDFKDKKVIDHFIKQLKDKITENEKLKTDINSGKEEAIDHAISSIEKIIEIEYLSFQQNMFLPYETVIEHLVDIFPDKP